MVARGDQPKRAIFLCVICSLFAQLASPALAGRGSNGSVGPCLERHHLPAFRTYSLGASFAGLPLSDMIRSCDVPPAGPIVGTHPSSVTWTSDAIYGTCTPEGFEGGCGPPLEVQSWPECDRNYSSYGTAESARSLRPSVSYELSGSYKLPTAQFEHGLSNRIEMYTGTTTIVIFTDGPEGPRLALRAAHALARMAARSVSSISSARLRTLAVSTRGCRTG